MNGKLDDTELAMGTLRKSTLAKFYTEFGFSRIGEEYLEDNIPHILMIKNK
jgi:predicted GNAT family N-acyltransferase